MPAALSPFLIPCIQALTMLTIATVLAVPALLASVPRPFGIGATEAVAAAAVLLHVVAFALGAGPVTALVVPELNPAKIRGACLKLPLFPHPPPSPSPLTLISCLKLPLPPSPHLVSDAAPLPSPQSAFITHSGYECD